MKFSQYLETQEVAAWRQHYLNYRGLKEALKVKAAANG